MMRWWRRQSIRARLTVAYALSLTLILIGYAASVTAVVAHRLDASLNGDLRRDFELTESMLSLAGDGTVLLAGPGPDMEHGDQIRAEAWDPSGALLARATTVGRWAGEPPRDSGSETTRIDGERIRTLVGPHSVSGRLVFVRVFRSEEPLHATLDALVLITGLGLPVGVAIAAIGGYSIAHRSLGPVGRMAARAEVITADRLDESLPVDNPHDEIGRLARVFNRTFARLKASFEQLQRFTTDVSHEFRTPLTSMRSVGEVALRRPQSAEAYRDVIGSMLEEVDRLTRLMDSLLTLSRADGGRIPLERAATELVATTRAIAEDMAVLADEKGQTLSVEGDPAYANIDPDVLRMSIVNLLDNAIKYGPRDSVISVSVHETREHVVLDFRDKGPGIPAEHRARIFERFYRVDKSRSRASGGVGLGLAIAQWAVQVHSGTLELLDDERNGKGATFRILLPRTKPGEDG